MRAGRERGERGRHAGSSALLVTAWAVAAAGVTLVACDGGLGAGPTPPTGAPATPTDPPPAEEPGAEEPVAPDCGPGRVGLRRLNRLEYDRTVRDLLGTDRTPARDGFPADDPAYGFDTVAEGLSLSPLLFEGFERAAERLAREAVVPEPVAPRLQMFEAEELPGTAGRAADGVFFLSAGGQVETSFGVDAGGMHELSLSVFAWRPDGVPPRVELRLDGEVVAEARVDGEPSSPWVPAVRRHLAAGTHTLTAVFVDDGADLPLRALAVDWLGVEGPFDADPMVPDARADLVPCDPEREGRRACAGQVLRSFARRAWRRPVAEAEVERLLELTDLVAAEGDGFDLQIAVGLQAILLSPHFVFRVELGEEAPDGSLRLTDHELATRLSYFLWRTTPDEALLAAADRGELSDPVELDRHIDRMLDDPRASAMIRDFAGQWLGVRALDQKHPDPETYPDFDDALRASMEMETERFVEAFLREDRSVLEMFDAGFTFVDDRLARHYGMPRPGSSEPVRVPVEALRPRGGLLFQGSFLTVTSHPRRTSPVKRGAIVLDSLLCSAAPPPPPGVEGLDEPVNPQGTLRERFEQHRTDPACATCHAHIDPIGFSLENFDAIGAWRTTDAGFPIDASGEMPDGTRFAGPEQLAAILADDPRFPACLTEKMTIYALGRDVSRRDACSLEAVEHELAAGGYTLSSLIRALIHSDAFMRLEREDPAP